MNQLFEVGDFVRFAHQTEPAGRVAMARMDDMFMGGQCVEIEGWVGEFAVSGLVIVEKARNDER